MRGTKRVTCHPDQSAGTCTSGGRRAPVSLGCTAQRGGPSEVVAGLTAVERFLPGGEAVLVAEAVCTMLDFWRRLAYWGKKRSKVPVSHGEVTFATPCARELLNPN